MTFRIAIDVKSVHYEIAPPSVIDLIGDPESGFPLFCLPAGTVRE